jgi:dienelactone hydrolase
VSADVLAGFTRFEFSHDGLGHAVFRAGSGPAVIVMPEMPGLHPPVVEFARRLVDAGYTTYLPSLFGTPGRGNSTGYMLLTITRACLAREFTVLATGRTSPIVSWLRALAARAHEECGGPGVGAVGMCFTGGFALAMMVDERVLAPVLSQPSLPLPLGRRRKADIGVSEADLDRIVSRVRDGACAIGLRFTEDPVVRPERFDTLRRVLGEGFIAVELDSSPGNPYEIPKESHAVLTGDPGDVPDHPVRQAFAQVLTFLGDRLR